MTNRRKDINERDIQLRKFYSEQRDKHLQQLMGINGQATFGALTLFGVILIGGLSLKSDNLAHINFYSILSFIVVAIGIVLLFYAGYSFSSFHTERIKYFEQLIRNPIEFDKLGKNDFQIMPRNFATYSVFIGLVMLLIGVFGLLFTIMRHDFC